MVIQSRLSPPDWTDEDGGGEEGAYCRKFPITRDDDGIVRNDAWFQDADAAISVCNGEFMDAPCPKRASCLIMALLNNEQKGVWGGLTGPQRRWIRRNVPKDRWRDEVHLRDIVPKPDYFSNLDDEDPDEDNRLFLEEQEALRAKSGKE